MRWPTSRDTYSLEEDDALRQLPQFAKRLRSQSVDFGDVVECQYGAEPVTVPAAPPPWYERLLGSAPKTPTRAEVKKREAYQTVLPLLRHEFDAREATEESFWCTEVESAAALTRVVRSRWVKWPWSRDKWKVRYTLNSVPDDRDIVQQFNRCSDLAIKADRLPGPERETATRLIFEAHSSALEALDLRRGSPNDVLLPNDLASVKARVDEVTQYYIDSARAQANTLYFLGTLWGAAFLLWLYDLISLRTGGDPFGPMTPLVLSAGGGALGAMVSVMQRMSTPEGVVANFAVPPMTLRIWGTLRPVIGALVGTIVQVLVLAHLVPFVPPQEGTMAPYSYIGLGFLAGFSERWAKDILAKAPAGLGASEEAPSKDVPQANVAAPAS